MPTKSLSDNAFVRFVNTLAISLMDVPVVGSLVRRGLVTIRYVGRRSGTTFETPVAYRRSGDSIVIPVGMPERKNWWRNFLEEGGPITFVGLDGRDRTGHAVATQDGSGDVLVEAHLDA